MKPTILLLPLSGLRIPASTGCRSARWPWQPKGRFVISRLWRDGAVTIPAGDTLLHSGDRLLVTTTDDELPELRIIFGHQEDKDYNTDDIDWNALDSDVVSRHDSDQS